MSLIKSKSPKAFKKNVETEMESGKSQPQSLAIAYSLKRKAQQKKSIGGEIEHDLEHEPEEATHSDGKERSPKERAIMAFHNKDLHEDLHDEELANIHQPVEEKPHDEHCVDCEHPDHDLSMVDRVMKKRSFSKDGRVSNEGEGEESHMSDSDPNDFDDLVLDDTLEFHETEANSGNKAEDHDRSDIVSKVMASRKKKDKLPNPR